jgi:Fe-S-cluster-containing hydrogenase component 2
LQEGNWFKLICGASFQDLPTIRSLTLAYTLAGADCIDVAADPAAIAAAREGLLAASKLLEVAASKGFVRRGGLPWLMVSLNDGEDPHFRKAEFDASQCPLDCPRPCERICPAQAIHFAELGQGDSGVIDRRCYGCGRCLPVCPSQLIVTRSSVSAPAAIASLIQELGIDAIEIHTQVGREQDFRRLWQAIAPWCSQLKLLAISCSDRPQLTEYLRYLSDLIGSLPCALIWQADGRPMSGDIGRGTTHAAIKLAQKVLAAKLPGYVQLAGGTNHHTVTKLRSLGMLKPGQNLKGASIAGIAYGSYGRSLLLPILEALDALNGQTSPAAHNRILQLEEVPDLLWQAVSQAHALVCQLKVPSRPIFSPSLIPNL